MAVLSEGDRALIHKAFMAKGHCAPTNLKTDIRAAVNAADDWVDTNAASFNTALPAAFKNAASASQKAILLAFCCLRRAGINL